MNAERPELSGRARARADTRARILESARQLIPRAGLSLPVTAIARHAGVAIQTIYDQFGSKGGLLVAVVNDLQRREGLYGAIAEVFASADGEDAMRRMNAATLTLWDRAWPYLEFLLRSRRIDPVVAREMDFVDQLRNAHYWAITKRLEDEGRLRAGRSADWAADQAFALSIPTVYEELVVRHPGTLETAIETTNRAVLEVILEPRRVAANIPPPDWGSLEAAAAARARAAGADPARLATDWAASTRPKNPIRRAGRPRP